MRPGMALANCDADWWDDVAVEINARVGLQRGLALIHSVGGALSWDGKADRWAPGQ